MGGNGGGRMGREGGGKRERSARWRLDAGERARRLGGPKEGIRKRGCTMPEGVRYKMREPNLRKNAFSHLLLNTLLRCAGALLFDVKGASAGGEDGAPIGIDLPLLFPVFPPQAPPDIAHNSLARARLARSYSSLRTTKRGLGVCTAGGAI